MWRKVKLRTRLLASMSDKTGPAYVPFIGDGDGDIAAELYMDRDIWAVDTDNQRLQFAAERLDNRGHNTHTRSFNADSWPFPGFALPSLPLGGL